jgi:hypothetical protein
MKKIFVFLKEEIFFVLSMKKILSLFLGIFLTYSVIGHAKLMYYNECTPSNDLKEYYKQILSSDKFKVSEDRIKKLDVYSKGK